MKNNTTNNGIKVNVVTKEIIITKAFERAASRIGSKEYEEMVKTLQDFPEFVVKYKEIKKKANKTSYKGLTIDEMKRFVSTRSTAEQEMFDKVLELANGQRGKYAIVKKWFLDNYKEVYVSELDTISVRKSKDTSSLVDVSVKNNDVTAA